MTVHPIDTEALRRLADRATPGPWEVEAANGGVFHVAVHPYPEGSVALDAEQDDAEFIAATRTAVPALLDALAAAEHRATRAEAQSETRRINGEYWQGAARGNALTADVWKESAGEAEARIKAVRDVLDRPAYYGLVEADGIRRALDGTVPPRDAG